MSYVISYGQHRRQRFFRETTEKRPDGYVTWNELHVLANLTEFPARKQWTIKELAKDVGMSYHGMLRLLHRMEKRDLVRNDKDAEGRKAWIGTSETDRCFLNEIRRRIKTRGQISTVDNHELPKLVRRARAAMAVLEEWGWRDHQIRDLFYRKRLENIEYVIRKTKAQKPRNPGGYFRVIVERRKTMGARLDSYMTKVTMPEGLKRDLIASKAQETDRPFWAIKFMKRQFNDPKKLHEMRVNPEKTIRRIHGEFGLLMMDGKIGTSYTSAHKLRKSHAEYIERVTADPTERILYEERKQMQRNGYLAMACAPYAEVANA